MNSEEWRLELREYERNMQEFLSGRKLGGTGVPGIAGSGGYPPKDSSGGDDFRNIIDTMNSDIKNRKIKRCKDPISATELRRILFDMQQELHCLNKALVDYKLLPPQCTERMANYKPQLELMIEDMKTWVDELSKKVK